MLHGASNNTLNVARYLGLIKKVFEHRLTKSSVLYKRATNLTPTQCFLQRVSIACYAERCISYRKSVCLTVWPSVRPSVWSSVTRWYHAKTT